MSIDVSQKEVFTADRIVTVVLKPRKEYTAKTVGTFDGTLTITTIEDGLEGSTELSQSSNFNKLIRAGGSVKVELSGSSSANFELHFIEQQYI